MYHLLNYCTLYSIIAGIQKWKRALVGICKYSYKRYTFYWEDIHIHQRTEQNEYYLHKNWLYTQSHSVIRWLTRLYWFVDLSPTAIFPKFSLQYCVNLFFFFNNFWGDFFLSFVLYSALPPLRFHCADGCWDRTQDRCSWCIGSQTL